MVRPVSGYGTLTISAVELVDKSKEAIAEYEQKAKAADYLSKNTPKESASDKAWREAVIFVRSKMSDAQRKRFDATAEKFFREGEDMMAGIKHESCYTLKRVYETAVWHLFDVKEPGELE